MASKRVSIDEYLGSRGYGGVERKHFARDSGVIIKAAPGGISKAKYDKDARTMRFVMSAEVEDRDRDIVVQAGLNTAEFEKNPVAPWSHRAGDPPVGTWSDLEKQLGGRPKRTEGTLTLVKGDVMADRLDVHFEAGSIRACSIGFMPLSIERREVPQDQQGSYFYPGYMIHEAELYECSPCCVPANPAALAKAAAAGDVLSREMIEEVLDTWSIEKGVLVPRKAFEDAHRDSGHDRKSFVLGGERFVAWKNAAGEPQLEKASTIAKGDFVSWSANGATARGKVTKIVTDGAIEVPGATVSGTADDPAAKITIYKQDGDSWTATDTKVAHKCSALTKIEPLKARAADADTIVEGLASKLLAALGLKGKTEAADPKPGEDGKKPAPEPTPEQKLRDQFAADLPALTAKHEMLEADARLAGLDSEMGQHVPA